MLGKLRSIHTLPADHPFGILVVLAVFANQFVIYGVPGSFSVFLQNMADDESLGRPSKTSLSFGNSVAVGLAPIFGMFCGRVVDFVGPRIMIMLCALFLAGGQLLSATVAHSPFVVVVTYSVPMSLASALMSTPSIAALGTWFDRHRSLAMGVAFSGGGAGVCVLPVVAGALLNHFDDWRPSFQCMSMLGFVPLLASTVLVFRRGDVEEEAERRNLIDKEAEGNLTSPSDLAEQGGSYLSTKRKSSLLTLPDLTRSLFSRDFISLFIMSAFFGFAFYSTLFAVIPFAEAIGKKGGALESHDKIDSDRAVTLMVYLGICEVAGSIVLGFFANRLNNRIVFVFCCAFGSIAMACWAFARTYAAIAVIVSIIGVCLAGAFAVLPSLVIEHFLGPNTGAFLALCFSSLAIGGFSGPPSMTSMQHRYNGDFTYAAMLSAGSLLMSGFVGMFAVPAAPSN